MADGAFTEQFKPPPGGWNQQWFGRVTTDQSDDKELLADFERRLWLMRESGVTNIHVSIHMQSVTAPGGDPIR